MTKNAILVLKLRNYIVASKKTFIAIFEHRHLLNVSILLCLLPKVIKAALVFKQCMFTKSIFALKLHVKIKYPFSFNIWLINVIDWIIINYLSPINSKYLLFINLIVKKASFLIFYYVLIKSGYSFLQSFLHLYLKFRCLFRIFGWWSCRLDFSLCWWWRRAEEL